MLVARILNVKLAMRWVINTYLMDLVALLLRLGRPLRGPALLATRGGALVWHFLKRKKKKGEVERRLGGGEGNSGQNNRKRCSVGGGLRTCVTKKKGERERTGEGAVGEKINTRNHGGGARAGAERTFRIAQ